MTIIDHERFNTAAGHRFGLRGRVLGEGRNDLTLRLALESAVALVAPVLQWRNSTQKPFDLCAGYLDDARPTALADKYEDVHLAAVHLGMFVALSEFALFCFTQRDFFPDIGGADEASPSSVDGVTPGLWLLTHTSRGGTVNDDHSRRLTPRSQTRYDMAMHLAQIMVRFVWLHEFAHCYNGHVEFAQTPDAALMLHDVALPLDIIGFQDRALPAWSIDPDLKLLELDADQAAFWASLQVQLTDRENLDGLRKLPQEIRVRLALFGVYASTFLFDEFQGYLDARDDLTHPRPYLRMHSLLRTMETDVIPRFPALGEVNAAVLHEFDRIAAAIPQIYRPEAIVRDRASPELQAELTEALNRLEIVREKLQPFRYAPPRTDEVNPRS